MATIQLNIEGMHCSACVRRVRAALATVPGASVQDVKVGQATVEVLADAGADATPDAVRAEAERAVASAGFIVTGT